MSFLLRYLATDDSGSVVHDETVVADVHSVEALEKHIWILHQRVTLRIEFDPPLAPVSPLKEKVTSPE